VGKIAHSSENTRTKLEGDFAHAVELLGQTAWASRRGVMHQPHVRPGAMPTLRGTGQSLK
jgi:hypothetical protein